MINYYKNIKGKGIQQIQNYSENGWIKVVSPTTEETEFLERKFHLETDLIQDALDPNELPRIEKEGENVYIYLRIPKSNPLDGLPITLSIILTPKNIITISTREMRLYETLENSGTLNVADAEEFLVITLHYIFEKYNGNVRKILKDVKKNRINMSRLRNKDILNLVLQEDILNDYISSLFPMISMYHKILKLNILKLDSKEKETIEDLIEDLNQTFDTCKSVKQTITNMRDYYSTTISSRMNDSITILTIFTVFLTIPAVLSSIYGMNIKLPFQESPFAFLYFIGIVVVIWGILFKYFRRMIS